ncbi:hypothetical protein QFZ83_006403 [Variovorax sp. W1I1]|uniref:hypothetical protein n=1 Tax=Variovorax sp. W1I1 TaxID=3042309 RepID=UPI0027806D8D|nr:hypothetical protein [Variovorax sp. W1I1]MDQ0612232.1 hypothetical protein [Variovorax sp. W1I1]
MSDSLVDIETLTLRCRAERAREYVQEAITCYRAGAYRSAIVNSWIAVVFDLIDKVRELALSGDANATAINTQYEAYLAQIEAGNDQGVKSALEFERMIVATCRDRLQFFNHQQIRDLDRLRDDRHQCAHPSFQRAGEPYRPSAEQARLHLRNAVEHVLSQPPVQGRSAIATLQADVASDYFPKDRARALILLRGSALLNANDALIRGFIDTIIFGYATPGSSVYGKMQIGTALDALLDLHRGRSEARISDKLSRLVLDVDDPALPAVALLVATMNEGTALLNEVARIRLVEFLKTAPLADMEKAIVGLAKQADLAAAARERILELDATELAQIVASGSRLDVVKERALQLLAEAGNFNNVNFRFSKLISPIFALLDRADVERVVRMPTETGADLVGAIGYGTFVEQVRSASLLPVPELDALLRENRAGYLVAEPEPAPET